MWQQLLKYGGVNFVLTLSFCLSVLFKQYPDDKVSLYCRKVFSRFFFSQ